MIFNRGRFATGINYNDPVKTIKVASKPKPEVLRVDSLNELDRRGFIVVGHGMRKDAKHFLWSVEKDGDTFLIKRSMDEDGNPICLQAEETTQITASKKKANNNLIWIRLGDNAEYEAYDSIEDAVETIKDVNEGELIDSSDIGWRDAGVVINPYFLGSNYISFYYGDKNSEYISDLSSSDKKRVETLLTKKSKTSIKKANKITPDMEGVWLDGSQGRYIGKAVQEIAIDNGWKGEPVLDPDNYEEYDYAFDAAEDYLNTLAPEGFYFSSMDGDWGLWKIEDDSIEASKKKAEESKNEFFIFIEDKYNKEGVGRIFKEDGKWHEELLEGDINFGGKTYQSYLTKTDILSWLRKDFPSVQIMSPSEAANFLDGDFEEDDIEASKKTAIWKSRLQKQYSDFEKFQGYDDNYGLAERLGFDSAEEAWEANPMIQGGTDPEDYKVIKATKVTSIERSSIKTGDIYLYNGDRIQIWGRPFSKEGTIVVSVMFENYEGEFKGGNVLQVPIADLEEFSKITASKKIALTLWKRPSNYMGEDFDDYYVGPGQSRDSDVLERANFEAALKMLGGENEPDVIVEHASHWAVGYVEQILVHKDSDKVAILEGIESSLKSYPVLDDDLYRGMQEDQKEKDMDSWAMEDSINILGLEKNEAGLWENEEGYSITDSNLNEIVSDNLDYGDGTAIYDKELIKQFKDVAEHKDTRRMKELEDLGQQKLPFGASKKALRKKIAGGTYEDNLYFLMDYPFEYEPKAKKIIKKYNLLEGLSVDDVFTTKAEVKNPQAIADLAKVIEPLVHGDAALVEELAKDLLNLVINDALLGPGAWSDKKALRKKIATLPEEVKAKLESFLEEENKGVKEYEEFYTELYQLKEDMFLDYPDYIDLKDMVTTIQDEEKGHVKLLSDSLKNASKKTATFYKVETEFTSPANADIVFSANDEVESFKMGEDQYSLINAYGQEIPLTTTGLNKLIQEKKITKIGKKRQAGTSTDIAKLRKDIQKIKDKLSNGKIYENFGQKEVGQLEDKYDALSNREIQKEIDSFNNWAMNYTGNRKKQATISDELIREIGLTSSGTLSKIISDHLGKDVTTYKEIDEWVQKAYAGNPEAQFLIDYAKKRISSKIGKKRQAAIMPEEIISIWDNGGETQDRYTIMFDESQGNGAYLALDETPNSPQGFSQWGEGVEEGEHLGKEIDWTDLSEETQNHIIYRLHEGEIKEGKMEKKSAVEWYETDIINELYDHFTKDLDPGDTEAKDAIHEEIVNTLDLSKGRYSSWGNAGSVTVDGTEYNVIEDEDEAERIAIELVKNDLETEPSMFNQDWLQSFITISDTDKRIMISEEEDSIRQDIESDADRMDETDDELNIDSDDLHIQAENVAEEKEFNSEEEKEEWIEEHYEELLEKAIEDARKEYVEKKVSERLSDFEDGLEDPVDYFVHQQGLYSLDDLLKTNFIMIDIDAAAESAIQEDSWAHFLSSYDGNYDTTTNGLVYFRES